MLKSIAVIEAPSILGLRPTAIDALYNAIEVLRRQPDGAWKLIVGDPNGRESGP